MNRDELYHYGTKGQKWHLRKYQNKDGTWTEEGKRRRRVGSARDNILDYGADVGNRLNSAYSLLKPKKEKGENIDYIKYKEEMEKMSDDELRKIVNRLNTENQYVKLKSERDISKGKKIALNALKGTAAAITLGSSAMYMIVNGKEVIVPLIKKLRR